MHSADFSILYQSSHAYICQLVFSVSQDRQLTEDIVQEIYLAAWSAFRHVQHPNPFGWLVLTARHKACDTLRRRRREEKRLISLDDSRSLSGAQVASLSTAGGQELTGDLPYHRIRPLLRKDEFDLIIAHYAWGYPVADLASRLGISPGACYMRLHRAKQKLAPLRQH